MRQDASTIENQMMQPCDAASYKQNYSFQDVARACDKWLKAKFPDAPKYGSAFGGYRRDNKPIPPTNPIVEIPKEKKPRSSRRKHATMEEAKAAMAAAAKGYWLNMTPEQRTAKLQAMAAKRAEKLAKQPKAERKPRTQTEKWKAYKLEWNRKRRLIPLTPEQLEKRREHARKRYAKEDPKVRSENHKKWRAERERKKREKSQAV